MKEEPKKTSRVSLGLFKLRLKIALKLLPKEALFHIFPTNEEDTKANRLYFILSSIGGEDFVDQIIKGRFDYSEVTHPKVSEARQWMM